MPYSVEAIIGENYTLGQNINMSHKVCVGNNVKMQKIVSIYEGSEIKDSVFCVPFCIFVNDVNPRVELFKRS